MANIMRVRVQSIGWQGGPGLNTFYFTKDAVGGEPDSAAAIGVVTRVRSAFANQISLRPTSWVATVDSIVDVIDPVTGVLVTSFDGGSPGSVTGTNVNTYEPLAVGLLCRLTTSTVVNGRRLRGRAYLSPVARESADGGTPDAASLVLAAAVGTNLMNTSLTPAKLVIWHRPKLGVGGAVGAVTASTSPDMFVVMRSRRD